MGFLSNLLEREAKRAISRGVRHTVNEAVSAGIGKLADSFDKKSEDFSNTPLQTTHSSPNITVAKQPSGERLLHERLEQVFANEWQDYTVCRNVAPSYLYAPDNAKHYDYVLYRNNIPVIAILAITSPSHSIPKKARLAKEACMEQNIPCLYFMSHLPNELSYISNRLRQSIQ